MSQNGLKICFSKSVLKMTHEKFFHQKVTLGWFRRRGSVERFWTKKTFLHHFWYWFRKIYFQSILRHLKKKSQHFLSQNGLIYWNHHQKVPYLPIRKLDVYIFYIFILRKGLVLPPPISVIDSQVTYLTLLVTFSDYT